MGSGGGPGGGAGGFSGTGSMIPPQAGYGVAGGPATGGNLTQPNPVPYTIPPQAQPAQQTGGGVAPFLGGAMGQQGATIGGQYLNPQTNQALQSYYNAAAAPMIQQFQQATDPSILGGAVRSGNLGGSAPQQQEYNAQTALAQGLGNLGANIYEPAYQQERQLQQQAAQYAPQMAAGQYLPAQMLGQVGQQQQQLQQEIMKFPFSLLSGAAGLVGPGTGGAGGQITVGPSQGAMK